VVKVRFATFTDIDRIVEMGTHLHAESPHYRDRPFDPEKVRALAHGLLRDESGQTCVLVAELNGKLVGMIVGMIVADWFGSSLGATDLTFYVDPAHRNGRAAVLLARTMEAWARDAGAERITPGISTELRVESTASFYEKLGYEPYGKLFCKDLKWA
jgi:GNAT superfamily N-acetyltransferase